MAEPTPLSGTRRDADALEREAMAAHLAGRDPDAIDLFTRAHNLHLSHGEVSRAARSAFWVAFVLVGAGELTRASGWIGRARRLLDEDQHDCVERGYVLLPHALEGSSLECAFDLSPDALAVTVSVPTSEPVPIAQDSFAWTVLTALVGDVTSKETDDGVMLSLVKRRVSTS